MEILEVTKSAAGVGKNSAQSSYRLKGKIASEYSKILAENNAYHALKAVDCLVFTGPTGTNVNDITVALLGNGMKK